MKIYAFSLLIGGVLLASTATAGTVTPVTGRASLGGTDTIDWAQLDLPPLAPISNPFSIASDGGVPVAVSGPQPGPFYSDSDGPAWNGNFAYGDGLLYSGPQFGAAGGPILIDFGTHLVSGGGAQIEPNAFFVPFIARIVAYDSRMNVLGAFTRDGYAEPANDDSAIFIGVRSTGRDIRAISVDVLSPSTFAPAHDFAINRFDFRSSMAIGTSSVPEPPSVVLLGTGASVLCGLGWSRRRPAARTRSHSIPGRSAASHIYLPN